MSNAHMSLYVSLTFQTQELMKIIPSSLFSPAQAW